MLQLVRVYGFLQAALSLNIFAHPCYISLYLLYPILGRNYFSYSLPN